MPELVLYRKYRPQTFGEVVGQESVVRILTNALKFGKVAHAYLFTGPRGTGKTTMARLLAKALNCASRNGVEPCNKCSSCIDVTRGASLDIVEIDAASHRGIDEIRSLKEGVRLAPSSSRHRVYIIDETHMLTREAFNALLKVLEEPPEHAVFILATTEAHKVPLTVLSRVQRFDFRRVSLAKIRERLLSIAKKENFDLEEDANAFIASRSEGCIRDAESLLGQAMTMSEDKKITLKEVEEILGYVDLSVALEFFGLLRGDDKHAALDFIQEMVEKGQDMAQFIIILQELSREMMVAAVVGAEYDGILEDKYGSGLAAGIAGEVKNWKESGLLRLIKILLGAKEDLKKYPLPQAALEVATLDFMLDKDNLGKLEKMGNSEFIPSLPVAEEKSESKKKREKEAVMIAPAETKGDLFSQIVALWPRVIEKVKPFNHSLAAFLAGASPQKLESKTLTLGVRYSFHKMKIEERLAKREIEKILLELTGNDAYIECVIDKNLKTSFFEGERARTNADPDDQVKEALKIIGGKLVE